ncbi:MAG: right-handed parallel beta-helix repeat-containing protein [Planctomycetes bacterium]|nr:right-handed parallel beta-helix repeat-containing protein [Planctomycetota bacterium]
MLLPWRNVLTTLVFGLAAARCTAADSASLEPPVHLPDGAEFTTWDVPPAFAKTYYVDQANPKAADENPGSEALPFKSINRAAQVLEPGDRVIVAAGVYRERVRPARGGTEPAKMIHYEAAPGAEVVISGSRVLKTAWKKSHRKGNERDQGVWTTQLPGELFAGENPLREVNLPQARIDRFKSEEAPIQAYVSGTLRRGLIFQNGKRLRQVPHYDDLAKTAGTYWVEGDGTTLFVRPQNGVDPHGAAWEVTTQGFVFAPETLGLGFIRVKGFTIQHCGNCFPWPENGALSTQRGHHWVIEENTVRQCNSIGIDIGDQLLRGDPTVSAGGLHIIRRNTITDCGIGGIEGKRLDRTLIEDNTIRRCGWHNIWRLYECGGIKILATRSCLVRRNLVTDTTGAPGIWLDYNNVNSRCTGNIVINADCPCGGIFVEGSQKPNLVDTNFVWDTHGPGIYQHDSDELIIAHNFVGKSTDAAVRMQICKGRKVMGRLSTAKRNKIINNIFFDNAQPLSISDPDNRSDYNVFAAPPGKATGLNTWKKSTAFDKHSVSTPISIDFKPSTLELRWGTQGGLPTFSPVSGVTHYFWRRPRGK